MNSLLKVKRFDFQPDWTLGKLLVSGAQDGFTIEDELRDIKVHGETAIPFGTYTLGFRQSPHFSKAFLYSDSKNLLIRATDKAKHTYTDDWRDHDLIWIKDVPGFEYILLHTGNHDGHTKGCLIVGSSIQRKAFLVDGVMKDGVGGSRDYYMKLYPKIYPLIAQGGQTIQYQIEAAPEF